MLLKLSPWSRASASSVSLQTVGLLCALIFVINTTYEVLVIHGLYAPQHFLIAVLLWVLSVWALAEGALSARKDRAALGNLNLALSLQLAVSLMRHAPHFPQAEKVSDGLTLAGDLDVGRAAVYVPLYLFQFMLICKMLIDAFSYAEVRRANQLEEQILVNRRAQEALRQSEERYRLIAERVDDVICTLDASARLTYVSPSVEKLTGYTAEETMQQPLVRVLTPDSLSRLQTVFNDALAQAEAGQPVSVYRGEFQLQRSDQPPVWAELTLSALEQTEGRFAGFVGVIRDISERKAHEDAIEATQRELAASNRALHSANDELAAHRDRLESLVLGRTLELATARAEAESANAVKTRFMANVSHEMRTPLQGILGYAEVGKIRVGEASPEETESYFDCILRSSSQLHTLVEGVLTLANKSWDEQAGLQDAERQEIDALNFSHAVGTLMGLRAQKLGQHLLTDVDPRCPNFIGDPMRLQQVFEHLLGNALRYSAAGADTWWRASPTRFTPRGSSEEVTGIAFEIADQGCGIPESEIRAVFEPFYESTRTSNGSGGTGLGLPLSRIIVERHGGVITLANRPGGGLLCRVTLPACPQPS